MRKWLLGVVLSLAVLGAAVITSYVALNYLYGERYTVTSTQIVTIENYGQRATVDNVQYSVKDAELFSHGDNEYYTLSLIPETFADGEDVPLRAPAASDTYILDITVPAEAYEMAKGTENSVTISTTTTAEMRPIDALPIAASIGIAMGVVALAVWAGYERMWGGATSVLLEHDLHDMTVRDVEIVGHIIELREFTIPELMKLTKASKATIWRTVQKLVNSGLVQQTDRTKEAANGLGGRGKPSSVYKYVGSKGE